MNDSHLSNTIDLKCYENLLDLSQQVCCLSNNFQNTAIKGYRKKILPYALQMTHLKPNDKIKKPPLKKYHPIKPLLNPYCELLENIERFLVENGK
jgi:hypothetical protein